jgi:hypothetical protein
LVQEKYCAICGFPVVIEYRRKRRYLVCKETFCNHIERDIETIEDKALRLGFRDSTLSGFKLINNE